MDWVPISSDMGIILNFFGIQSFTEPLSATSISVHEDMGDASASTCRIGFYLSCVSA